MARVKTLAREELDPRQLELYDRIAGVPEAVRGPFKAWLHSPELCDRIEALGKYVRFDSDVSLFLKEIAILQVARTYTCQYMWIAHQSFVLQAGVPQDYIDAIATSAIPAFKHEDARVVHE
ncbi:carboxymuconolactone decarboxylase family protein [Paracoccus sp. (in: a-proteobacteria)]|uniref:carboxymuconolactone decarboxylase family protein n=1 Tax=Paracoccus sp. TaxID=267 RepID=UPI0028AAE9BE|nr:carboxymuconolactone decarboxylase family protein [Paracoccus sp. (in: a-proteobacteria)]